MTDLIVYVNDTAYGQSKERDISENHKIYSSSHKHSASAGPVSEDKPDSDIIPSYKNETKKQFVRSDTFGNM